MVEPYPPLKASAGLWLTPLLVESWTPKDCNPAALAPQAELVGEGPQEPASVDIDKPDPDRVLAEQDAADCTALVQKPDGADPREALLEPMEAEMVLELAKPP